jgi:hypothetical protein
MPPRTIVLDEAPAGVVPDATSQDESPDPQANAWAPYEGLFLGEDEYLNAPQLLIIGNRLRTECSEFRHLEHARIEFLWKKAGGKSKGKARFGQCNKPSGMLAHYCPSEFIIWIAADHVREAVFTNLQLEALVYHEMKHCGFEFDDKTGEQTWVLWPHDNELFLGELTRYGAWQPDLQRLVDVWEQIAIGPGA